MSLGNSVLRFLPKQIADRIIAVPFSRRLARGAFWVLAGAVAARVVRIPISVILARLMGPTNYGELGIVSGSIDLFATFAGFGLGLTATKYVAELKTRDPLRAGRILAASTIVAAVSGTILAIALFALAPELGSPNARKSAADRFPAYWSSGYALFCHERGTDGGALWIRSLSDSRVFTSSPRSTRSTAHVGGILFRGIERRSVGNGLFAIRCVAVHGLRPPGRSATP